MTVGIVGLGLIGGSFAKAYHEAGATVLAWNRSRSVLDFAIMSGAVDAELTEDNIAACDLVLIALYPEATIEWFRRMAPHIGAHPVVLDCGGTKRTICAACFPIAKEHGVTFLGGVLVVFGLINLGMTIKDGMQGGGGQLSGAIAMIVGGAIVVGAAIYFGQLNTGWAGGI